MFINTSIYLEEIRSHTRSLVAEHKGFRLISHRVQDTSLPQSSYPISVIFRFWCKWQKGRALAQAVSRRAPTAEAQVRSRVSPCGICCAQSGTGTGFPPSTSGFPCQFNSTGAPLLGKIKKTNHLHHRVAQ